MGEYVADVKKREKTINTETTIPSVLKMMEEDPELKDFFKLIREGDFREKAVALLAERLEKRQLQSK